MFVLKDRNPQSKLSDVISDRFSRRSDRINSILAIAVKEAQDNGF